MTECNVATVVGRLLGNEDCHLHESVTRTIAGRVLGERAPRAVVVSIDGIGTKAWGACHRFATLGSVEIYC